MFVKRLLLAACILSASSVAYADVKLDSLLCSCNLHWDSIKCDADDMTVGKKASWKGSDKEGYYSGALLGNGLLGANLYKLGPDVYRLNFSRSDVTEQRTPYGLFNQARLPIGYFTLATAGHVTSESMDLSLYDAQASGSIGTDKGNIDFSVYVHSLQECMVFESCASGGEDTFIWDFVPFKAISPRYYTKNIAPKDYVNSMGMSNPEAVRIDKGNEHFVIQALARDTTFTDISKYYVVAWKEVKKHGRSRTYATITFRESEKDAVQEARSIIRKAAQSSPEQLIGSHKEWWHDFYHSAAMLTFPDKSLERFYWMQYYKFASTGRPGKPVVDLQGVWPTFDTPWPAIWANLNLQLTYCWQTKANLGWLSQPLWDAMWKRRDNLRLNVTEIPGQEGWTDSACMPRSSSYDLHNPLDPELAATNAYEVGNLAWTLSYFYRQCLAYNDIEQMRDRLFPLLKEAVNLFFHIRLTDDKGKYSLPSTASPEYGDCKCSIGPNSNYDLANLRQALITLIEINENLGLDDPDDARWKDFLDNMPDFQYDDATGFKISETTEFLDTEHRHYSHLFMIYPYHMLDWNDAGQRAKAEKSIERWHGNAGYSRTAKAAMLSSEGKGDQALDEIRSFVENWVKPNTLYAESGPVIETPLAAVSTLHEFYMQDWGDRIRVFYGCPQRWSDAEFCNMRASGAFLVSARRQDGHTAVVRIRSEAGHVCRIQSDMKMPSVVDTKGRHVSFAMCECPELSGNGSLIEFETAPGEVYTLTNAQDRLMVWRMSDIEKLRGDKGFLMMADRYCTISPATVMDKPYSITGDYHNYESIASYVWPDPDHPGKYITRDGIFNPDCDKFDRTAIFSYTRNLMVLSKAYYLTGDDKYRQAWLRHVNAFHFDEATFMYPNFNHGQMIVGTREGNLGEPGGIIDAFHFVNVTESIRLMNALGGVDEQTMARLKSWFGEFCDWLTDSYLGQKEGSVKNNHATAYDVLVCALASFCGKDEVFGRVSGEFVSKRIDTQILPDGRQPQELVRTKPMRYSMFNLLHIVEYCHLMQNSGVDFYLSQKERIDNAFSFIASYLGRHDEFPYPNILDAAEDELFVKVQICKLEGLKGAEKAFDYDSLRVPSHLHSDDLLQDILNWEYEMFDYDDALTPPNRAAAKNMIREYWESIIL